MVTLVLLRVHSSIQRHFTNKMLKVCTASCIKVAMEGQMLRKQWQGQREILSAIQKCRYHSEQKIKNH